MPSPEPERNLSRINTDIASTENSAGDSNKNTLYLVDIVDLIAEEHDLSKSKSRRIVTGIFDWIVEVNINNRFLVLQLLSPCIQYSNSTF
jgi:hypothetical protein